MSALVRRLLKRGDASERQKAAAGLHGVSIEAAHGGTNVQEPAVLSTGDPAPGSHEQTDIEELAEASIGDPAPGSHEQTDFTMPEARDIEALIAWMEAHRGSASAQEEAARTLREQARTPEKKRRIADAKGIEAVIAAMQAHAEHAAVQEQAAGALLNLAVGSEDREQKIVDAKGVEALIAAMQAHAEVAAVQEPAAMALWILTTGSEERKQKIAGAQGIEALIAAMQAHADDAAVQEQTAKALWILTNGSEERKQKIVDAKGIEALIATMQAHAENAAVQQPAAGALRNMLSAGSHELRRRIEGLLDIHVLVSCIRSHPLDAPVQEQAIGALVGLLEGADLQQHASTIQEIGRLLIAAMKSHKDHTGVLNVAVDGLLGLPKGSCTQRSDISTVLSAASLHSEVVHKTARLLTKLADDDHLALIAKEDLDGHCTREQKENLELALAAAADARLTAFAALQSIGLPIQDTLLDVPNMISLWKGGHILWSGMLAGSLLANGFASAALSASAQRFGEAALDLITFGTGGTVVAGVQSWRLGHKLESLLTHKVVEALESVVSLGVTVDAITLAGSGPGYEKLEGKQAVLRWISVALSCVCLPLLGKDLAKRTVLQDRLRRYQHLLPAVRSNTSVLSMLCFHAAEVLGHFVWVLSAFCLRPNAGVSIAVLIILIFLGISSVYLLRLRQAYHGEGFQIPLGAACVAAAASAPLFAVLNLLGLSDFGMLRAPKCGQGHALEAMSVEKRSDLTWSCLSCKRRVATGGYFYCATCNFGTCTKCYRQQAPDAGPRFEQDVAISRPLVWACLWAIVVARATASPDVWEDLCQPHAFAVLCLAAFGFLAYLPLAAVQASIGRWSKNLGASPSCSSSGTADYSLLQSVHDP